MCFVDDNNEEQEEEHNIHKNPYYLVVFPERRTLKMAETICELHGGSLPVPENIFENDVR